ncbi:hypothetical protein KY312_03540, partial [Candidatus Woesearchaeota archaeon]|nr:hypothetical protein [Candidatus Woesearchaeota archaeon]
QINQLFASTTDKVVLPEFRKQLKRGQSYTFALGIKNYLEQRADFNVRMSFSQALVTKDESSYQITADISKWIFEQQGPFTLNDNEQEIISLPVHAIGAEEGITYVFDVTVNCDLVTDLCNPYGYKQKIYIDIID